MKNKKKILVLSVVLSFASMIIIAALRQSEKGDSIFFEADNSLENIGNVIEESIERMKNQWNLSDNSVIVDELLLVDDQKRVWQLSLQLTDTDYTNYQINMTAQQPDSDKVSVRIYNDGKAKGDLKAIEALQQAGFPVGKYEVFWNQMQEMYQWEDPCMFQYCGISQRASRKEPENTEAIYLDSGKAENDYYFSLGVLDEYGKGSGGISFYFPVGE